MSNEDIDGVSYVVAMAGRGGVGGQCLRCRAVLKIQMPVNVDDWCIAMGAFVREHKNCKRPPADRDILAEEIEEK